MSEEILDRLTRLGRGVAFDPALVDRVVARLPARPEPVPHVPSPRALRRAELPLVFSAALGVLAAGRFVFELLPAFGDPLADALGLAAAAAAITALYRSLVKERTEEQVAPPSGPSPAGSRLGVPRSASSS